MLKLFKNGENPPDFRPGGSNFCRCYAKETVRIKSA